MTVRRILVLGVSGVGKSTACARVAEADPGFLHLRASRLLSEATGQTVEALRVAPEDAIRRNQELLAAALDRRTAELEQITVLLDGHAVIDNDRTLFRVSTEAVAALRPDGMLLLEASPEVILQRRAADGRNRPFRTTADLLLEINAERDAILGYRESLQLPLDTVWAEPIAELEPQLSALLRNSRAD